MSQTFRRRSRGFTLIEVVIVLAMVAILAAVALPSYRDQVRSSRRTEARETMMSIQAAQERWRSSNTSYAATLAELGRATETENYTYEISGNSATGYTLVATAREKQAGDSTCATIELVVAGAETTHGPADACWAR
ncbi:MAG: type IV pilin protein [Gammaproteobacteria bacterium]